MSCELADWIGDDPCTENNTALEAATEFAAARVNRDTADFGVCLPVLTATSVRPVIRQIITHVCEGRCSRSLAATLGIASASQTKVDSLFH